MKPIIQFLIMILTIPFILAALVIALISKLLREIAVFVLKIVDKVLNI